MFDLKFEFNLYFIIENTADDVISCQYEYCEAILFH